MRMEIRIRIEEVRIKPRNRRGHVLGLLNEEDRRNIGRMCSAVSGLLNESGDCFYDQLYEGKDKFLVPRMTKLPIHQLLQNEFSGDKNKG